MVYTLYIVINTQLGVTMRRHSIISNLSRARRHNDTRRCFALCVLLKVQKNMQTPTTSVLVPHERTPIDGRAVLCAPETLPPSYAEVLGICIKRLKSWRIPPNWSASDWFKEIKAVGAAAAWQAEGEFDSALGVPMSAFLYQRILARVFTRYRQEWAYALHLAPKIDEELNELALQAEALLSPETVLESESVRGALDSLSSLDRRLVVRLFWQEHTESQIARSMGISQSAVSKRKHVILRKLRSRIESAGTAHSTAGIP
jgi:RNA polymerase sigma factor (sigma-70 family)